MAKYAEGTTVSVRNSMDEAKRIVTKHGGKMVSYGWRDDKTEVFAFVWNDTPYRFVVPHGKVESENRRQWRVLCALKLKPLFELMAESKNEGTMHLDAYRVLENGSTVSEAIERGIAPKAIAMVAESD